MLNTIPLTQQLNMENGCVMLLGGFDGLHVGHKQLVARAKAYRLPIAIMTIFHGKSEQGLFTSFERESIFKNAGIDFVIELPFADIKNLSPEAFIQLLMSKCNVQAFVCGDDFRFGKNAVGNAESIKRAVQVCVEIVDLVQIDGEKASATTVKKHLQNGDVETANRILGEEFFLIGKVIKDRGVGKTLGFPTANILYPMDKFPLKQGVYETRVCIDGKAYKAITNYGARPTFEENTVLTETYLDGFDGDLYGQTLQIRFVRFLRENQKFDSVEKLKNQLQKDIMGVREND